MSQAARAKPVVQFLARLQETGGLKGTDIANERLSMNEREQVIVRFKRPFRDGTTVLVLDARYLESYR